MSSYFGNLILNQTRRAGLVQVIKGGKSAFKTLSSQAPVLPDSANRTLSSIILYQINARLFKYVPNKCRRCRILLIRPCFSSTPIHTFLYKALPFSLARLTICQRSHDSNLLKIVALTVLILCQLYVCRVQNFCLTATSSASGI